MSHSGKQAAKTTLPQTHCLQEANPKNTMSGWSSCQINPRDCGRTLKHSYNWFILKTLGYVILQTQTTILKRFHHNQYVFLFVRRAAERGIVIDRGVKICAESPGGSPWKQTLGSSVNRNPMPRLNTFRTACTDLPHSRKKHAALTQMGTKQRLISHKISNVINTKKTEECKRSQVGSTVTASKLLLGEADYNVHQINVTGMQQNMIKTF